MSPGWLALALVAAVQGAPAALRFSVDGAPLVELVEKDAHRKPKSFFWVSLPHTALTPHFRMAGAIIDANVMRREDIDPKSGRVHKARCPLQKDTEQTGETEGKAGKTPCQVCSPDPCWGLLVHTLESRGQRGVLRLGPSTQMGRERYLGKNRCGAGEGR